MVIDVGKTMPPPRNMTGTGNQRSYKNGDDWGDGKHGIVVPTLLWSHMLI